MTQNTNTSDFGDFNLDEVIDDIATTGTDQSQEKKGPEKMPEGPCFARIFAVIEYGVHEKEFKGEVKKKNLLKLGLEISGKNYPPIQTDNGPVPRTLWLPAITLSQDNRSGSFKLFQVLRHATANGVPARHFAQLLGNRAAFKARIKYSECGKYVNIEKDSLQPARNSSTDEETGETIYTPIAVQPLRTKEMLFVFSHATPGMWDSIHVAGEFKARTDKDGNETHPARSRNVHQEMILQAENFDSLPCAEYARGTITAETQKAVDEAVGQPDKVPEPPKAPPMDDFQDDDIPF